MKQNYDPWNVNNNDFAVLSTDIEKIKFLIRFAILAPSGHNSQPWFFTIEGNQVFFYANKERSLAISDAEGRQLLTAFGCALENFSIAASYFGFTTNINYLPQGYPSKLIAIVTCKLNSQISPTHNELMDAIVLRHTNREKYKKDAIPNTFLEECKTYENNGISILFLNDPRIMEKVGTIVSSAQIETMDRSEFREELSHFVKSNLTYSKTGMPGFTLGIPLLVSFFASYLIKKINLSRVSRNKELSILNNTPTFVFILSRDDTPLSWIQGGQVFERTWLLATKVGLVCAPLAAAVQDTKYRKELREILQTNLHPNIFLRIGYPIKIIAHSPRFSAEELIMKSN